MKKKVVAAVVTLAMMTVAATGCSKQSEEKTADGKGKLYYWNRAVCGAWLS